LNLPARPTMMSRDPGTTMTLIGYRRLHPAAVRPTGPSSLTSSRTHDETGPERRAWAALPGEEDSPGPTRQTGRPVIQTDPLRPAGTGQQGKRRGQAPLTRRVRFSTATRTYLARVPTRQAKGLTLLPMSGRGIYINYDRFNTRVTPAITAVARSQPIPTRLYANHLSGPPGFHWLGWTN